MVNVPCIDTTYEWTSSFEWYLDNHSTSCMDTYIVILWI